MMTAKVKLHSVGTEDNCNDCISGGLVTCNDDGSDSCGRVTSDNHDNESDGRGASDDDEGNDETQLWPDPHSIILPLRSFK